MHIKNVRPCTGPASANGFLNIGRFNLEITPEVTLYDMTLVRAPHGKLLVYGPQTAYGAPSWSMAPRMRNEIIRNVKMIFEEEINNAEHRQ